MQFFLIMLFESNSNILFTIQSQKQKCSFIRQVFPLFPEAKVQCQKKVLYLKYKII